MAPETVTVVGIDPGLANLGIGAVRERGREVGFLGSELIRTSTRQALPERLARLFEAVTAFLRETRPDAVAVEGQFFHHQRESAFKVGQAYGICLLAAAQAGIPVYEYGPLQVKQALVGTGRASKEQVAFMVRGLLGLRQTLPSHHVADALALALTHLSSRRLSGF